MIAAEYENVPGNEAGGAYSDIVPRGRGAGSILTFPTRLCNLSTRIHILPSQEPIYTQKFKFSIDAEHQIKYCNGHRYPGISVLSRPKWV